MSEMFKVRRWNNVNTACSIDIYGRKSLSAMILWLICKEEVDVNDYSHSLIWFNCVKIIFLEVGLECRKLLQNSKTQHSQWKKCENCKKLQ